jgi:hypothetical protein
MPAKLYTWWRKNKRPVLIVGTVIIVILIAFTLAVYSFGWDWLGFNGGVSKVTKAPQGTIIEYSPGKTLWDWMQLLIVPIVLAVGGFWLNQIQKSREESTTERRAKAEQKITEDNQREAALQDYIDSMSELLLHEHLRESQPRDEVRKIARVRTLTLLTRLDGARKGSLIHFLYESDLIAKGHNVVDLSGADLSGANLSGVSLPKANLREVNLYGANLRNANLFEANLSDADLSFVDLTSATITNDQLNQTRLLKGATMTDGSIHH